MSTLNNSTSSGLLQPTKFLVEFDRIKTCVYFCQEANIPGITLNSISVPTPLFDLTVAGNKLNYTSFDIEFLVDDKLESWKNIHNWFRSIAAPPSFEERNQLSNLQSPIKNNLRVYSDCTLTILSNLNNPYLRVNFINMFPISLSEIRFDTKQSAKDTMTARASFAFEYFDISNA